MLGSCADCMAKFTSQRSQRSSALIVLTRAHRSLPDVAYCSLLASLVLLIVAPY
jgi:hypothetical protein